MTDDAPRTIRQARELIRTGRLPGMAAETLSDTIVEYKRMRAAAAQAPIPEPAPQAARPPPRELTPDELFQNLRRRCDANREAARAQGIEPYETGEWRSVHEAAKHLVNRKDAPRDALPYIRELFEGYHRWETRQPPRHAPPAQSHSIRY